MNPEVDFDFIVDNLTKKLVIHAYEAVSQCELWDYMKRDTESYAYCIDPELRTIYAKIKEIGYHDLSPNFFGLTMRHIQYIAQHGLPAYKEKYLQMISKK